MFGGGERDFILSITPQQGKQGYSLLSSISHWLITYFVPSQVLDTGHYGFGLQETGLLEGGKVNTSRQREVQKGVSVRAALASHS